MREYRRPAEQGYSKARGGVEVLNNDTDPHNDRWLINWGGDIENAGGIAAADLVAISEVDPNTYTSSTAATVLFELSMHRLGQRVLTYRLYHQPESAVTLPLKYPP